MLLSNNHGNGTRSELPLRLISAALLAVTAPLLCGDKLHQSRLSLLRMIEGLKHHATRPADPSPTPHHRNPAKQGRLDFRRIKAVHVALRVDPLKVNGLIHGWIIASMSTLRPTTVWNPGTRSDSQP